VAEVEEYVWPKREWFDYGTVGPPLAEEDDYLPVDKWAGLHADCAHLLGGYEPIFGRICDLCGMEQTLMNMSVRPAVIEALVERITEFLCAYYEAMAQAGRGVIDILAFGDDFASQTGMMFSPEQWRCYFKPAWEKLFAIPHRYGMKSQFHSCGSVRAVIGDLIEAGLDILEVVQVQARDMEAEGLARDFGGDLTFLGTVDVQGVLPRFSEGEVRREVRRLIDIFGPGGRFILGNTHILMEDVPAGNVMAMFDEARRYRKE
jgi:uroporphyrinogen decarboxylase